MDFGQSKVGFSGVYLVGNLTKEQAVISKSGSFGEGNYSDPCSQLFFDLSSLTKIIAGWSIIIDHFSGLDGWLDKTLGELFPECVVNNYWFKDVQLVKLINHQAGFKNHFYFFHPPREGIGARSFLQKYIIDKVNLMGQENFQGSDNYSDVGLILLSILIERKTNKSIDQLWSQWKSAAGLKPDDLIFNYNQNLNFLLPTETRYSHGEVNDDNCSSLDGASLHCGLFGTAIGVWQWIKSINNLVNSNQSLQQYIFPPANYSDRFFFGWDTASGKDNSHASKYAATHTIGHLGYTGTSIWWDWKSGQIGILLTNRQFPDDSDSSKSAIFDLRQNFYKQVFNG